jgi:ethanolamine ammonia-lyase small subunit
MDELISREIAESPLRRYTTARVGLGESGTAISTAEQLRFQLDHARARDAVHDVADFAGLLAGLRERKMTALMLESAVSGVDGRRLYLRRPDLGRKLAAPSAEELVTVSDGADQASDAVIVIVDGLSALAIDRHALAMVDALMPLLGGWAVGPVCMVRNGRVAIGDQIGALLKAKVMILMIGERPGLSAPDSLGVYLTWEPRPGRTDAERNCISNIRLEGLGYEEAARRIVFYLHAAREVGGTGYMLKEASSPKLHAIG